MGTNDETYAMTALGHLPMGDKSSFDAALKSILVKSKWQFEQFDGLYEEFWEQLKKAVDSKTKELPGDNEDKQDLNSQAPSFETLKSWLYQEKTEEEKNVAHTVVWKY